MKKERQPSYHGECPFTGADIDLDGLPSSGSLKSDEVLPLLGTATPFAVNAFFRQALANVKYALDTNSRSPFELLRERGFSFFSAGLDSRLLYQVVGLAPAVIMGDKAKKEGVHPAIATIATTAWETSIGTILESRSFGAKDPIAAAKRAIIPFFFRNSLGWLAINFPHETLSERAATGCFAGLISAFPDLVGNKMIARENITLLEGLKIAMQEISSNPIKISKSAGVRGLAGATSGIILSGEVRSYVANVFNPILAEQERLEKGDVPNSSTSPDESSRLKEGGDRRPPELK